MKLTTQQVDQMKMLYEREGWRPEWLAKKFRVTSNSVLYYIERFTWKQKVKIPTEVPQDIAHLYRDKKPKNYRQILKEARRRSRGVNPDVDDTKVFFVVSSLTGRILGCEKTFVLRKRKSMKAETL